VPLSSLGWVDGRYNSGAFLLSPWYQATMSIPSQPTTLLTQTGGPLGLWLPFTHASGFRKTPARRPGPPVTLAWQPPFARRCKAADKRRRGGRQSGARLGSQIPRHQQEAPLVSPASLCRPHPVRRRRRRAGMSTPGSASLAVNATASYLRRPAFRRGVHQAIPRGHCYLMAPAVSPDMILRWATRTINATGRVTTTTAASIWL